MVSLTQITKTDNSNESPFEYIRRVDTDGNEFWLARELMPLLGYKYWRNFREIISIAEENVETVTASASDHFFPLRGKPNGRGRPKKDYKLFPLAVLFVLFNCDSRGNTQVKQAKNIFLSYAVTKSIFSGFESWNPEERQHDKSGFVYLVKQSINGYCKIGKSKNPYKRLQSLQTGNPLEVVVLERVFSLDCFKLEHLLHQYFSAYWIRGEWFDLSDELISEFGAIAMKLDAEMEIQAIESPKL